MSQKYLHPAKSLPGLLDNGREARFSQTWKANRRKPHRATREPSNPDQSPKKPFSDTLAGFWASLRQFKPSPLHFISVPRVNRSTGQPFYCAPFYRLESSETGVPRRGESESFRKVPSAGWPRIRAFPKLPHSPRPQHQPDLCQPGKPPA